MRKLVVALEIVVVAVPLLFAGSAFFFAERADYGFEPGVPAPNFTGAHPRVVIDEAHHNASTGRFSGRYWPFARLLKADGYAVERGTSPFNPESFAGVEVLVVADAAGAAQPQFFGIDLPLPSRGERGDPAFTPAEVAAVRTWVGQGGALLLIADTAPFGTAAAAFAAAFGVRMHGGFVEVPGEGSDPLLFTATGGRLGEHPILAGDGPATQVRRVMTYTGQSLDGPEGAAVLLRLPETAVEVVPVAGGLTPQPAGVAQALALESGRGRVVVLGEGAMATAQVAARVPYGFQTPDNDNLRFVLNVMHWLSRRL